MRSLSSLLGVSHKVNSCPSVLMWPLFFFFSFFLIPVCRSIRRNIWGAYVSSHILQQNWPTTGPGYKWPDPIRGDSVLPFHLTGVVSQWLNSTQKIPPLSSVLPSTFISTRIMHMKAYLLHYLLINSAEPFSHSNFQPKLFCVCIICVCVTRKS